MHSDRKPNYFSCFGRGVYLAYRLIKRRTTAWLHGASASARSGPVQKTRSRSGFCRCSCHSCQSTWLHAHPGDNLRFFLVEAKAEMQFLERPLEADSNDREPTQKYASRYKSGFGLHTQVSHPRQLYSSWFLLIYFKWQLLCCLWCPHLRFSVNLISELWIKRKKST